MTRRDPIRTFARVLVAAGISIALLAVAYVPIRASMMKREIAALGTSESRRAFDLRADQDHMILLRIIGGGVGVAAFGYLLLAFWRPEADG